jgi:hypothetical protein
MAGFAHNFESRNTMTTKISNSPMLPAFLMKKIESTISRATSDQREHLDNLLVLQGRALALQIAERAPLGDLRQAEFKVFSQYGEDGILQYLIRETGITRDETSFVEFGVQDYSESNTRFLLMNDHWRGMIIDGSEEYMAQVRAHKIYWRHDLTAVSAWIDRDNINHLIGDAGFGGEIGILSVDIDGNDYWVWERIDVANPVIVVAEYNSIFGGRYPVSVPYDAAFQRDQAHYSHMFWGASIAALVHLGMTKGYALVGSNTAGNNLFFVRNDRLGRLKQVSVEAGFVDARYRESRDIDGNLTFLGGAKRRLEIMDLPVVDVVSGEVLTLRSLDARRV